MERFKKIIDYVKSTCWYDDTEDKEVVSQAYQVYEDLIVGKTKRKFLYRLCGQTGSGKTTQLLASVERLMLEHDFKPVILGVRSCAEYHPKYEYFKKHFPKGELREKTNGFALKCMSYVLKLLIENGYMVLLDITLLDPIFEEFVLDLLNENGYEVEYHILAVNKFVSESFIQKRLATTGRIIYKASSDYFYHILPIGLEYITKKDNKNSCYVWNAFDEDPVYFGKISECLPAFKKAQKEIKKFEHTEEVLRESKYKTIAKKK